MNRTFIPALLATTALFFVPACGGGGSSSPGGSTSADILLTDAPTDELLSFNVTVDSVRLYAASGARSENLLSGTVRVDVLNAATQLAWLTSKPVPSGTWSGVEVGFDPLSVDARLLDGTPADVLVLGDELAADFPAPIAFAVDGYRRCIVDFDLDQSLAGDAVSGFILDPVGSSSGSDDPATPISIDDITGRVKAVDTVNNLITIDAWADDERSVLLGSLQVAVEETDQLQDDSGTPFPDRASFYASLVPDVSIIEVHGMLAGGQIDASRIELEDGLGGDAVVRMRGIVVGLDAPGSNFTIAVAEIKKGLGVVEGVHGGVPASLQVQWSFQTLFQLDDGSAVSASALAVGADLDIRFTDYSGAPFIAQRVELDSIGGEYEGSVSDDSGIPSSFQLTLQPLAPAIQSGEVSGPITVSLLSQPSVWLDTGNEPELPASWIQLGQRVSVKGQLDGATPWTRELPATEVRIKPGRADASVIGGVELPDGLELYAIVDEIADPFGDSVDSGSNPMVLVPLGCVFTGDITSFEEFSIAMNDAENYPVLDITIKGIADPDSSETIVAFEIEVETN